jgi:hypothetical protein
VSGPPLLTVASTVPLLLRGDGFAPGERVELTVTPTIGAPVAVTARADADGGFLAEVEGLDATGGLEGVAAGDAGGRASFQFST